MGLSHYALEQMGFALIPEGERIEAYFKSLSVYEIRGINSDKSSPLSPEQLKYVTEDFSFSIGDSVNAICRILVGDDFVNDEEKWREERKSTPPYLIVLTGLTDPAICEHGYWKFENQEIVTHDCFTEAKETLKKKENRKTATFVTSLTAALSSADHPVVFAPIAREVFATTNHDKILRDFRLTFKGEIYSSKSVTTDVVASGIEKALLLYRELDPKVGYFFDLAIRENDALKKFIYYFIVIEIYTHQTFKELDYGICVSNLNNIPQRVESSAKEFLVDRQKESKNLFQRFMWCSILKWTSVDDADITQFKSIKRFRDQIYHGEEIAESSLPVHQAKQLALKLLGS